VLSKRIWKNLLGVGEDTVIESVTVERDEAGEIIGVVARVRPRRRDQARCPACRRRCPRHDRGDGQRRWRALDLGTVKAFVVAEAPRVDCRRHGVRVAWVPWARHDAWFTHSFEQQVAWLTVACTRTAVCALMRISWTTVGAICARVVADQLTTFDPLEGLRRIGIDEIHYRKGHRYLTVVVDHDSGRLVWAAPGRSEKTVEAFFDALGDERAGQITVVTADAASWMANVVDRRCSRATRVMGNFHVVQWATDALDEVRREVWNDARRAGMRGLARQLKGTRYALWKNPEDLTDRQQAKLADIAKINGRLYRAYLLKEELRLCLRARGPAGKRMLDRWLEWAQRSRIEAFVKLGQAIKRHRPQIEAARRLKLSNALVESMNTKIRVLHRRAFGFHTPEAMIAMAMLALGGLCPPLPGRPQ
jgi:transposase